jgi:hypothetical protein
MVTDARGETDRRRLGVERHHAAVLVDAVLAERRELDEQVYASEELLSEAGEHVFVS